MTDEQRMQMIEITRRMSNPNERILTAAVRRALQRRRLKPDRAAPWTSAIEQGWDPSPVAIGWAIARDGARLLVAVHRDRVDHITTGDPADWQRRDRCQRLASLQTRNGPKDRFRPKRG